MGWRGLEEGFGYGVGHEFASAGEDDAVLVVFEEAEGEEFGDGVGPRGEVGGVDAVVGADGEGEDFGGAGGGGEGFGEVGDGLAVEDLGGESGGIGEGLPAVEADGGEGAGAEAEVIVAFPVGEIVEGMAVGEGIVGDFVMEEACGGEGIDGGFEEIGIEVDILVESAELELAEVGGVLFVGETISGEMFWLEGEGLGEGGLPLGEGLGGDGEDEIEINIGETGFAEGGEGFLGLGGGVGASEDFEEGIVPGLDAEADSGDAGLVEESGFFWGDGGGVGFESPFGELGEIEAGAEAGEEVIELGGGEGGGGTAAEVDGFWEERELFFGLVYLGEEGIEESGGFIFGADLDVEAAIGAEFGAEGDMEVEMADGGGDSGGSGGGRGGQ